jgi:hypothetical protein
VAAGPGSGCARILSSLALRSGLFAWKAGRLSGVVGADLPEVDWARYVATRHDPRSPAV